MLTLQRRKRIINYWVETLRSVWTTRCGRVDRERIRECVQALRFWRDLP